MKIFLLTCSIFIFFKSNAQLCSAENLNGCDTNTYGNITGIRILLGTDTLYSIKNIVCNTPGSSSVNRLLNSGNPIILDRGKKYKIEFDVKDSTSKYKTATAAFYDNDGDGDPSDVILSKTATTSTTLDLPCTSYFGTSYLRLRSIRDNSGFPQILPCGSMSTSGSIFDIQVTFRKVIMPTNFTYSSGNIYEHLPVSFQYIGPKEIAVKWIADNSVEKTSALFNPQFKWDTGGVYNVKLITKFCTYTDSISKQISIITPTTPPIVTFTADKAITTLLNPISYTGFAEGAFGWQWTSTAPSFISSLNTPNTTVEFYNIGRYSVCFRAKNDVGYSKWFCKNYWCVPKTIHTIGLGNTSSTWDSGVIYDDGGPCCLYNNNRRDSFQIDLQGNITATQIIIHQLKLADTGDRLKIYEGTNRSGKALHPTGGFTKGNIPTLPIVLNAKSPKVFISFESDSSGRDSGFKISWKPTGKNEIMGHVFYDTTGTCIWDPWDIGLDKFKVKVGSKIVSSNFNNGLYKVWGDYNPKVIEAIVPAGWKIGCPVSGKDTWTLLRNTNVDFGIVPDTSTPLVDIQTSWLSSRWDGFVAVRGLKSSLLLNVRNNGNFKVEATCSLKSNKILNNFKLAQGNFTATDTTLNFKTSSLDFFERIGNEITFQTLASESGDLIIKCKCYSTKNKKDNDSSNNEKELKLKIVNAHDPNDKQATQRNGLDHTMKELDYFVRFQNTGTWPATDVIVRDTLSTDLDTNSLELMESSHSCILERNGYALSFNFHGINLQDSARNEPESHGWIYYTVKPKSGLPMRKQVLNTAYIYFDVEAPVVTNTTNNFWETGAVKKLRYGALTLYPVPASDKLFFNIPGNKMSDGSVSVFGINGEKMLEQNIKFSDHNAFLNTSGLHVGIYFIQYIQDEIMYSGKFNIQR